MRAQLPEEADTEEPAQARASTRTKLTLTISKPGATTQVIVVTVRKGKKPLVKT